MKFSCPNCAAKYQIGDDKVAGRTVKMKCRKCGTTIPIRAEPSRQSIAAAPIVRADSLLPSSPSPEAVGLRPAPVPAIASAPVEVEWHAGIDGKSVGPMTLREIRRRVKEGSINAETYLWKEGMVGWEQIPLIPELSDLLTERRVSLVAAPPSMPAPAKAQAPSPALKIIPAPAPVPLITTPSPLIATPSPLAPVASHPLIQEAPAPAGWEKPAAGTGMPGHQEAPIPDIAMPMDDRSSVSDSIFLELKKKRQNPFVIPFAVLAAVVFGVTIGFVLFGDQETKIVTQIVEVPAKVGQAIVEKRDARVAVEAAEVAAASDTGQQAAPSSAAPKSAQSGAASPGGATPGKPAEVKGLSGLAGLEGLGGPSGGPKGPSESTGGGGQPLSTSQIESTVAKYRTSVKRGCWERALQTRDKSAPNSARVTVAITVAPSGSVTGANAGGDPSGYGGLASCIAQRVRAWSFPRSSGQTTVNVPFVFAAQ